MHCFFRFRAGRLQLLGVDSKQLWPEVAIPRMVWHPTTVWLGNLQYIPPTPLLSVNSTTVNNNLHLENGY